MNSFKREEHYIVFKISRLDQEQLEFLERVQREIPQINNCVVVESDWPEYETVWKMIEERVTGSRVTESEHTVEMLKLLLESSKDSDGQYAANVMAGKIKTLIGYLEDL